MQIQEVKQVLVDKVFTKSYVCNKCGYEKEACPNGFDYEFQKFLCSFGYGSKFDCESWEFHLCESCLVNLIKEFKYSPLGFGIEDMHQEGISEQQKSQSNFDEWKSSCK